MSLPTAPLVRLLVLALLALTALLGPAAPAGALVATLVVATYNVHNSSPYAGTVKDLKDLLAQTDAVVLQEVGSDSKHAAIAEVLRTTVGVSVLYSPGEGDEAIVWHTDTLSFQTKGSVVLSEPTPVGHPQVTVGRRYLTWGRFTIKIPSTDSQLGVLHLVARPHLDDRRATLLRLEVRNLRNTIVNLDFKKPLIGGDFNVDYDDPWLDPLRNIPMRNDHQVLGELKTFPASAPTSSLDQWWFRPAVQTGIRPQWHRVFRGSSDHLGDIVSFSVQY